MRKYAGIGSRSTPHDILEVMRYIGGFMAGANWLLRSGHAAGADMAFELGCMDCNGRKEIYIPWNGFNEGYVTQGYILPSFSPKQIDIAATFHPAWEACTQGARKLHTRNVCQILGDNLEEPVDCVICWTPHASGNGGTGQAIRIAKHYGIPVFDLADTNQRALLEEFVNGTA
jgi:hypothetical protein